MAMLTTDDEWPSGCPGPGRPIPKKWDHDGFYREQYLYAIHCAMNADVIHAQRERLITQLRKQRTAKKGGRPTHGKKVKA